ncbi:MAG: ABC transporter substrate-binding protein [Actinomycetota bacterium]
MSDKMDPTLGRRIQRRSFLRRAGMAGLAIGATPTILAACGDDDDSGSSATTGGTGTSASDGSTTASTAAAGGGDFGTLNLQLNWITNAEFAGSYVAVEEGYYAANGFETVNIVPGGPDVAVEPAVVAGNSKLAYTVSETMAGAVAEGAAIKVIGALFQNNPFGVMSFTEAPILEPADMVGKSIGVQAVNDALWDALLEINGIDPGDVNKVPAGFDPAPFVNGEVDGWFSFVTNEPNILRAEGYDVTDFSLSDFGFKLYQQLLITTEDVLANEFDLVSAALKSEIQGWQRTRDDIDLGLQYTMEIYGADLGLDEEASRAEIVDQLDRMILTSTTDEFGLMYMTDEDIAENVATLESIGLPVDSSVYTTEVLDALYADGIDLI